MDWERDRYENGQSNNVQQCLCSRLGEISSVALLYRYERHETDIRSFQGTTCGAFPDEPFGNCECPMPPLIIPADVARRPARVFDRERRKKSRKPYPFPKTFAWG